MNNIIINGKSYTVKGNNVEVRNSTLYVDGVKVTEELSGTVNIEFIGELANLKADGSVRCDDVGGDVSAGGSVNCDDVGKNVNAGGSVNCDDIQGSAYAGGSIRKS